MRDLIYGQVKITVFVTSQNMKDMIIILELTAEKRNLSMNHVSGNLTIKTDSYTIDEFPIIA